MKYSVTITGIGPDALFFLEDCSTNFLIIFNESAPPELQEISILHTETELQGNLEIGDTVTICGKTFKISAIGSEATHTLKTLGHCTLGFNGGDTPERPGYIMLEGEAITPDDIVNGMKIEIY